jgi:hypothetical protein
MTNVTTKVLLAGTADDDDLQFWSTLCGERHEQVATRDSTGAKSISDRRVAVLTPGQIAQLRAGQALIITRGMPPAIGRVKMAWKRWDLRMDRFHIRPPVQWSASRLAAAEDWAGTRLIAAVTVFRSTSFAAAERIDRTARRLVVAGSNQVTSRLLAGLEWLDSRDPAREFVARLRLAAAMRKARAALAARGTRPAQIADQRADADGERIEGRS